MPLLRSFIGSQRLAAWMLAVAMVSIAAAASAQTPSSQSATPAAATTGSRPARAPSKPSWSDLTPSQKAALAPLSTNWSQLSETHKRKWIALAANFSHLTPSEQSTLQARMKEWVALSPQQRTQARLNFGETQTQQFSPDEKKAKWEAYQALPAEERRRLATTGRPRTPATAAPVKPVPADKLAIVPRPSNAEPRPARIVIQPAEAIPPGNDH